MVSYLGGLTKGKIVLWCYFIWYLVTVYFYFDSTPRIWLNSLGISGIIGVALMLSVSNTQNKLDRWQILRLFLMPFCVSSFSSLIKGQGYILIFPPTIKILSISIGSCLGFLIIVMTVKFFAKKKPPITPENN